MTITCNSLNKTYMQGDLPIHAVRYCNIKITESSFTVITGASGSGKTTLLNLLAAFDLPTTGTVMYDDRDIFKFSAAEQCGFHNKTIGYVFQDFRLLPILTVRENILTPAVISKNKPSKYYFESLVETLGLSDRLDHLPHEISGGQRQRCAVARALINKPDVLLADEPTGNLDREASEELIDLLLRLHSEYKMTAVIVTHDERIAEFADSVYHMEDGEVRGIKK